MPGYRTKINSNHGRCWNNIFDDLSGSGLAIDLTMDATFPIMTLELAREIEQMDIDYSVSRMGGMRSAPDNPLGIEIQYFGDTVAFLIKSWPDFWYGQKVLGLSSKDSSYLGDILRMFQEDQLDFRFEIIPGNLDEELAASLNKLGFVQTGFSTALYGIPRQVAQLPPSNITVQPVVPSQIDLFIDLYQDSFEYHRLVEKEKQVVKNWIETASPALDCYLAYVDNIPAGIGILFFNGKMALLADAAVLPRYRSGGCHTALIQLRIERALERNCTLLTSFPAFGSSSHRNLERAGLRIAYTKTIWYRRAV